MKRGPIWYYQRFVPKRFSHVDTRKRIRHSLETRSLDIARIRRDALVVADDNYWRSLALEAASNNGISESTYAVETARYESAVARAQVYGYIYKTVDQLAHDETSDEILRRISTLKNNQPVNTLPSKPEIDALLGGEPEPTKPKVTVSEAFQIYLDKIVFDEISKKSKKQYYSWKKVKTTSVNYFLEVIGDVFMEDITREMATSYRDWWIERMILSDENEKPVKPNTANRHIGNMRKLYEDYFTFIGEEERLNPFRKMFFKDTEQSKVPSFENDWVRTQILKSGVCLTSALMRQI